MSDVSPTTGRYMVNQLPLLFGRGVPLAVSSADRVSKVSAMLSTVMLEEHDGQLTETAQRLCTSRPTTNVPDGLLVHLFLLSNKFTFWDVNDGTPPLEQARRHDADTIGLMQSMGLYSAHQFQKLYSQDSHTSAALVEQLFASVVRTQSLAALRTMLDAGVSPNLLIDMPDWRWGNKVSPLEYAAGLEDESSALALSDILLCYGASTDRTGGKRSALFAAIYGDHRNLIFKLVAAGARISAELIDYAKLKQDFEIEDIIIKATGRSDFFAKRTPLGRAVEAGDVQQVETLLSSGVDINSREPITWDDTKVWWHWTQAAWKVTTPLGLAANSGNTSMMARLLESGAKIDMPLTPWVCPLILALSQSGNQDCSAMLLRAGADVRAAEANAASLDKNACLFTFIDPRSLESWIYEFLIDQGAYVGPSQLLQAARRNNLDVFSVILRHVKNDKVASYGDTINYALETGNTELILKMHLEKVPLNQHLSWVHLRVSDVKMLDTLEEIGLLQSSGALAESILSWAIQDKREDLVRRLLALDIKFRHHEQGECVAPLDSAISCSNLEQAQLIIERGAVISQNALNSAVWESLRSDDTSALHFLLDIANCSTKGAFLLVPFSTAYYMAVLGRSSAILQVLFDAGIDPSGNPIRCKKPGVDRVGLNFECCEIRREAHACHCTQWEPHWWRRPVQDPRWHRRESVLEAAIQVGDRTILQTLLQGALWSRTYLGAALCNAILEGKADLVEDLLNADADVNCLTEGQPATALCLAVHLKDVALVKRLLSLGAQDLPPPSARYARTALQKAVDMRDMELIDILLDAGANVNAAAARMNGATALQCAAMHGYLGIARRLLDVGADVNARRAEVGGRTALQAAAEYGRLDMLSFLLNSGVQVEGSPYRREYVRAVKLAEINGHMSAANFLKSQGGWDERDGHMYTRQMIDSDEGEEDED